MSAFRHVSVKLLSNFAKKKNPAEWGELNYLNVYPNLLNSIFDRQFGWFCRSKRNRHGLKIHQRLRDSGRIARL